jgi:hypothetical protein
VGPEELARKLSVLPRELDQFLSGDSVMSTTQQAQLAALVIAQVPRLASRGHALRAQVVAATAYATGETEIHKSEPTAWSALKRRPR